MVRTLFGRLAILLLLTGAAALAPFHLEPAKAGQDLGNLPKAAVAEPAPEISFATVDGRQFKLSDFRGKPVLLWLIATWCPTCEASAQVLAENIEQLARDGLVIVTLKLYENLGYPGPDIATFGKKWAGDAYTAPNWLWGDAGKRTSFIYDPPGFPDIYWLVDAEGILRAVDTAPNVTIDKIRAFAAGS